MNYHEELRIEEVERDEKSQKEGNLGIAAKEMHLLECEEFLKVIKKVEDHCGKLFVKEGDTMFT